MAFSFKNELRINASLREELSRPFGTVVKGRHLKKQKLNGKTIYAVGDVTVAKLLAIGLRPRVAIFDFRSERAKKRFPIITKTYKNPIIVHNKRGMITRQLWVAIRKAAKSSDCLGIHVIGEEDLASLPCIYFAKHGDIVMYGIRGLGIAIIEVNDKMHGYVADVMNRMR